MSLLKPVITTIRVSIHRSGDSPLFGETATWVETEDEGGGLYLRISQPTRWVEAGSQGSVLLNPDELPALLEAARLLGVTS